MLIKIEPCYVEYVDCETDRAVVSLWDGDRVVNTGRGFSDIAAARVFAEGMTLALCSVGQRVTIEDGTRPVSDDTKRYEHDCESCVYLGPHDAHDLYFCEQHGLPTVIARFGDDDPDYTSGMMFADVVPELGEAKRRAQKVGLL